MLKLILPLIVSAFLVSPASHAVFLEDGWSMNGGSDNSESDNAWFSDTVGEAPVAVDYCVQVGPNYPYSQAEGELLVEKALAEWAAFLKQNGLDGENFGYRGPRFHLVAADGKMRRLPARFNRVACAAMDLNGPGKALQILLGTSNPALESAKGGTPEQEYAAAIRSPYNQQTFNSNGVVWVGALTQSRARIYHLLIHELGHVLGMKHDSVFVMDAQVVEDVKNPELEDSYFGRIESQAWPYTLRPAVPVVISGDEERESDQPRASRLCERDETVLGVLPGSIRAYFKRQLLEAAKPCVRIEVEVVESRPLQYDLKLNLVHKLHAVSLKGTFVKDRKNLFKDDGPGLYTKWMDLTGGESRWLRMPLNKETQGLPARGTFTGGRAAIEFPARIQKDRGFSVELYDQKSGKWFVLRNPYNR